MKKLAVLISNAGTGTNLQAIIDAIEIKKISAEITAVISDTDDAYGLQRAKKHGISTHVLTSQENSIDLLTEVDFIVLSGWKKIISEEMINRFPNKILNIHPGLIPDSADSVVTNPDGTTGLWNKGKFTKKAIQNFLDRKATYAGSSIHFLTKEFDFGPVLARCFVKILPDDTVESLYERLKIKENEMYVNALISLCHPELVSGS